MQLVFPRSRLSHSIIYTSGLVALRFSAVHSHVIIYRCDPSG